MYMQELSTSMNDIYKIVFVSVYGAGDMVFFKLKSSEEGSPSVNIRGVKTTDEAIASGESIGVLRN